MGALAFAADVDVVEAPRLGPGFRRRTMAALTEAERTAVVSRRLERRAARQGRKDAEGGRWPPRRAELQRFAGAYAAAFVRELRDRWPAAVVGRVLRARPWLVGGQRTRRAASLTSRPD